MKSQGQVLIGSHDKDTRVTDSVSAGASREDCTVEDGACVVKTEALQASLESCPCCFMASSRRVTTQHCYAPSVF